MPSPLARKPPRFPPPPLPDDPAALTRLAIALALEEGFVAAGVVRGDRAQTYDVYRRWLDGGLHGEMSWLERDAEARETFDSVLPYTRAILAVAREVPAGGPGNVARYARGEDYHTVVRRHLKNVAERLAPACPPGTHFRVAVDTAPLLEREVAARAGLGFIGNNGLLIVPGVGSHVVLGELLTDVDLAPTLPLLDSLASRCGTCTTCLDDCPAGAFVAPRLLDARRCISYLTIEKRGPFTPQEEGSLDGWLFGCDVCQDVCPFNAASLARPAEPYTLDPAEAAGLDEAAFEARFGETALQRTRRDGLVRNARAALGA